MINRKLTFENIKKEFGSLSQKQVEGFDAFFNEFEHRGLTDYRFLAYMLATAWHETDKTMRPIEEYGKGKGKAYEGKYYGRGYVQLTWLDNYKKATAKNLKGWDFILHPELMLQVEPAIWTTFEGMINGWFTGKKLKDYFGVEKNDAVNARRIINGVDCAIIIRQYYDKFLKSIV